jgi:hypothetical protein
MRWNAALNGTQTAPDQETTARAVERKGLGGARGFEIPMASSHLKGECHGKVVEHGVVAVTASDVGLGPGRPPLPKNAADLDTSTHFASARQPETADIPRERNHWLCYDFKEPRVVPTHYAIRSLAGNVCRPQPGSVHGENWVVIDIQEELSGMRKLATFPVGRSERCRSIKLVNVGGNCQGTDSLNNSACEIFGSVAEENHDLPRSDTRAETQ